MRAESFLEEQAMQAYRVETHVQHDGQLTLDNLPLHAGEAVEVIILVRSPQATASNPYPLRGTAIIYHNPTEPIAADDWEATQ
jgi:hypothetical protein